MKTSSRYVIAFFLSKNGLKFLLIKAEKAAGFMDILFVLLISKNELF